jgi:serine/threonine protein kinase
MFNRLEVISGPDRGRVLHVTGEEVLVLGRGKQSPLPLNDLHISRVHCELRVDGQRWIIVDRDSVGGTFVNGQRVTEQELRTEDVIRIGVTVLRLTAQDLTDKATIPPETPSPVVKPAALTIGQLGELSGRTLSHFQIGEVLAKAQSGLVFKARDRKDGRAVAFKILAPEYSKNAKDRRRFIRSMRTMLPMRHPNLVTIYGAGKTGPYCWISMEYIEGESLTQVIRRIGTAGMLDWTAAFRVAFHVARALDCAHKYHIVHRNITPQNILIQGSNKAAKLGDLMLAKAMEGGLAEQITRPGEILGDVRYISPERAHAPMHQVDHRSDIYSLGAVTYALLTGRPPFEGSSVVDTIMNICQSEVVKPKKYQLSIPDQFEGIVLRMLQKRPEDRYQSAEELLRDLAATAKYHGLTTERQRK